VTGAGGSDNRFRTSGGKLTLLFCGSSRRQEISGPEKTERERENMDSMSSLVAINLRTADVNQCTQHKNEAIWVTGGYRRVEVNVTVWWR
jgi:hypothetical protein